MNSDKIIEAIQSELLGTCNMEDDLAESLEVDVMVILDHMADAEVERCVVCDWWVSHDEIEMVDDEPVCEDCREDEEQ